MNEYLQYVFGQAKISLRFKEKLSHNYHELTLPERLLYFLLFRPFWNKEKRFFFEACRKLNGQMYIADRRGLCEAILEFRPLTCFEIGTYTGGGSTYFIAEAFAKLGKGKLITLENDRYFYNIARQRYNKYLPRLLPFLEFVLGDNITDLLPFIAGGRVDCVFLDGAEDASQTKQQYLDLLPYFKPGSVLMAHDWFTAKAADLKPMIECDPLWELVLEIKPPQSVGFVVFKRK